MRVDSLEVRGCHWFSLNPNMYEFTYKPDKKISCIIGTNGAGKTALLNLLIPSVVKLSEFDKDGYLRYRFRLHDHDFLIGSENGKYLFYKDKEDLNARGTYNVQRGLVDHFTGLDDDIRKILIGTTQFSKNDPALRRSLLERLSGNDYAFINKTYKLLFAKMKESKSVLEFSSKRLNELNTQLQSLTDESVDVDTKLAQTRKALDKYLELVDSKHMPVGEGSISRLMEQCSVRSSRIKTNREKIIDLSRHIAIGNYHNTTEILRIQNTEYNVLKGNYETLSDRHAKIKGALIEYHEVLLINPDNVKEQIKAKKDKIANIRSIIGDVEVNTADKIDTAAILSNMSSLVDKLSTVDRVDYKTYLDSPLDATIVRSDKEHVDKLYNALNAIQSSIKLLKQECEHNSFTCPKCDYVATIGEDKREILKQQLVKQKELERTYTYKKTQLTADMDRLERQRNIENLMDALNSLPYDKVGYMVDRIKTLMVKEPKSIANRVNKELQVLHKLSEIDNLTIEIKQLELKLNMQNLYDTQVNKDKDAELVELEDKMRKLHARSSKLSKNIEHITAIDKLKKSLHTYMMEQEEDVDRLDSLIEDRITTIEQDYIGSKIKDLKADFSALSLLHSNIVTTKEKIKVSKRDVAKYDLAYKDYKLLVDTTNPKGKLIARSIVSFINAFIEEMNGIINSVWEYPVEISPLDKVLNNISYRFKFTADGDVRSDISLASTATSDMIDMAFKMVAMRCLGLEQFPLFLDEVGKGYDERHVIKICEFISSLADNDEYSNIFLVAQHRSIYEYFGNHISSFMVMSDVNLSNNKSINLE